MMTNDRSTSPPCARGFWDRARVNVGRAHKWPADHAASVVEHGLCNLATVEQQLHDGYAGRVSCCGRRYDCGLTSGLSSSCRRFKYSSRPGAPGAAGTRGARGCSDPRPRDSASTADHIFSGQLYSVASAAFAGAGRCHSWRSKASPRHSPRPMPPFPNQCGKRTPRPMACWITCLPTRTPPRHAPARRVHGRRAPRLRSRVAGHACVPGLVFPGLIDLFFRAGNSGFRLAGQMERDQWAFPSSRQRAGLADFPTITCG